MTDRQRPDAGTATCTRARETTHRNSPPGTFGAGAACTRARETRPAVTS